MACGGGDEEATKVEERGRATLGLGDPVTMELGPIIAHNKLI